MRAGKVLPECLSPAFTAAAAGTPLYTVDAWAGILAYTFQIYFDFSGYSDMAVGLAKMFGIVLPLNFNSPYKATSMIDFWRRWHMTLSRFLKDYVYIPLGGNKCSTLRNYGNLLATMIIGVPPKCLSPAFLPLSRFPPHSRWAQWYTLRRAA